VLVRDGLGSRGVTKSVHAGRETANDFGRGIDLHGDDPKQILVCLVVPGHGRRSLGGLFSHLGEGDVDV
jgi:hypothetical protein